MTFLNDPGTGETNARRRFNAVGLAVFIIVVSSSVAAVSFGWTEGWLVAATALAILVRSVIHPTGSGQHLAKMMLDTSALILVARATDAPVSMVVIPLIYLTGSSVPVSPMGRRWVIAALIWLTGAVTVLELTSPASTVLSPGLRIGLIVIGATVTYLVLIHRQRSTNSRATYRKRAELETGVMRRQRDVITHLVSDAILVVDDAGTILLANRTAELLLGWSKSELEGGPLTRLLTRKAWDSITNGMGDILDGVVDVVPIRHKDGRHVPVAISITRIWLQDRQSVLILR